MIGSEECERIIREHYREIFNYCLAKLRFLRQAAEDCTQEIFLTLYAKRDALGDDNIRLWLYRTADNVIKAYLRRESGGEVSLGDVPDIPDASQEPELSRESVLDCLTDEERHILEVYAAHGYGNRRDAARELGLSLAAMYQRIHRIKQKLKNQR